MADPVSRPDITIPTEAWELLTDFPSPEDVERALGLVVAAELQRIADDLAVRATERYQVGEDNGPECDGECEMSGCHAMAAAGVYLITEHRLRRRAAELRGGDTP